MSQVKESLSKLLKIGSSLILNQMSEDISEYNLPKSTPIKTKRIIVTEAKKFNEANRLKAIEIKLVYDIIHKYLKENIK